MNTNVFESPAMPSLGDVLARAWRAVAIDMADLHGGDEARMAGLLAARLRYKALLHRHLEVDLMSRANCLDATRGVSLDGALRFCLE